MCETCSAIHDKNETSSKSDRLTVEMQLSIVGGLVLLAVGAVCLLPNPNELLSEAPDSAEKGFLAMVANVGGYKIGRLVSVGAAMLIFNSGRCYLALRKLTRHS